MRFDVKWQDGYTREVEVEQGKGQQKRARAQAVWERRNEGDGRSDTIIEVSEARDTDMDVCEVRQAADGGWWIVVREQYAHAGDRKVTLPCPHCEKPVTIREQQSENVPGKPMVLWEFKDKDTADGLATMVNVMILTAVMGNVTEAEG